MVLEFLHSFGPLFNVREVIREALTFGELSIGAWSMERGSVERGSVERGNVGVWERVALVA